MLGRGEYRTTRHADSFLKTVVYESHGLTPAQQPDHRALLFSKTTLISMLSFEPSLTSYERK
jgi:hypothetical protein